MHHNCPKITNDFCCGHWVWCHIPAAHINVQLEGKKCSHFVTIQQQQNSSHHMSINTVSTIRCLPTQASLHMHHISWVWFEKYCGDVHELPEGFHYSVHDASILCFAWFNTDWSILAVFKQWGPYISFSSPL